MDITFVVPQRFAPVYDYSSRVSIVALSDRMRRGSGVSELNHRWRDGRGEPRIMPGAYEHEAATYRDALLLRLPTLKPFDVIHAHDWLTYEAGLRLKEATGKKLVVHVHSTEYDRADKGMVNEYIAAIERRGMASADRIIAVSQYTKDLIVDKYRQQPNRIDVVHNADVDRTRKSSDDRPEERRKVVAFVGRITHQKGPADFLKAARGIWRADPDVEFVMAGDGDLLPDMRRLASSFGMAEVVSFPGFLDAVGVSRLLQNSAVLVMPSVSEPFGLVALEAINEGAPVVMSTRCGLAGIVRNAIKVEPGDAGAITDGCMKLLQSPLLARHMADGARREVSGLSWLHAAKQLREIYMDIVPGVLSGGRCLLSKRAKFI